MASSSSSSSSSSAPAKSSQPLHNFELPPLLKWNSKDGKSGGSHKRHRSMKSPSQRSHAAPASSSPLRRSPPNDSLAPPPAAPRQFQTRESRAPPPPPPEPSVAVGGETKEPALVDEFDRLSLLREETLRHYRGRDWWSETDKSDVIAYRRNPLKKSAFAASSARIGHSSNSAGETDAYRGNSLKKSAFAASPASFFNSEEDKKSKAAAGEFDAYKNPFRKSFFGSNSEERRSNKAAEGDAYLRNPFKKSGFAYPKIDPKNPFLKKSAFAFKTKHNFSDDKGKLIEKKSSNPKQYHLNKYAFASQMKQANSEDKSKLEKKSPKKKLEACSSNAQDTKVDKKSKGAEADRDACPKINPLKKSASAEPDAAEVIIDSKKGKEEEENPKKETDQNGDEEEIKVWNLRPRIVKTKPNTAVAGNNPKNKAQQQLRSGATKSTAGKSGGGGEQEKEKLSIAISLTKQEIEEDIFALTGAKPSRRPKKRPKNVQKQLDTVFPGLWLMSITPESYKVSENSLKD